MATKTDSNEKTVSELDQQIRDLQALRNSLIERERKEDLEKIKSLIKLHDFREEDLGFTKQRKEDKKKSTRSLVPARYFDPTGIGKSWSGRGIRPQWIKDYLKANPTKTLKDLENLKAK